MYPAILLFAGADAVVAGEGEGALRAILARKGAGLQAIPGVFFVEQGIIRHQPGVLPAVELDLLPPPARDLIPLPSSGVHLMETSRGCPHRCMFCETSRFYQHAWRAFSPAKTAREAARLVEEYDARVILFADDNSAASSSHILKLARLLQNGPQPVFFMASARVDELVTDARIIPALAAAGISRIAVGVETLQPNHATMLGKHLSPSLCRELFDRMHSHGMYSVASFIVGLPGERSEFRRRMVEAAVATGTDSATFVPFCPLPTKPFPVRTEVVTPREQDEIDAAQFTSDFFTHSDVIARRRRAMREHSIRGMIARAGQASFGVALS